MEIKDLKKEKLQWLLSIVKKDVHWLTGTLFLGLLASLLGLVVSVFSQKLIDTIIPSHDTHKLFVGLCIALGIIMLKLCVTTTQQYFSAKHTRIFNLRLIDTYFKKLLYLPKSFFDQHDTGALIARMNDSASIQQTVTYIANTLVLNILILVVSTTVMFFYSVPVGLMAIAAFPIFLTIALAYKKKLAADVAVVMDANAKKESYYISTIQNTDLLKAHNKEHLFAEMNHDIYDFFQSSIFKSAMTGLRISSTSELTGSLIYIMMLSYASYQMITGKLSVGEFTATLGIATGMLGPIGTLGFAVLQFQGANVAFDRMYEFISKQPEYELSEDMHKVQLENIYAIEFDQVFFSYQEPKPILKDLSFQAVKGEMLCIFGENGSGKSTILKLLMYLYQPVKGDIRMNDQNIKDLSIYGFREKIAIVAQQSKLFDKTVIENICFESGFLELNKAIDFLNTMGFEKYIGKLADGYQTMVYGNGENLSGGQKQMISLARALCKKPDVLLLDEPTASMDAEAEDFVIDILKRFSRNRIAVIVTHKQNPARESDRIMILENGAFCETGTHDELIMSDNLYSRSVANVGIN